MAVLYLKTFFEALERLDLAHVRALSVDPQNFATAEELELIRKDLEPISIESKRLNMPTVIGRLAKIEAFYMGSGVCSNQSLHHDINETIAAVRRDAGEEYFCHYDKKRLVFLREMPTAWNEVFTAFKSATVEIEEGIDCYALGHNTACVFHMCRVAEIGLRAIAKERGIKTLKRNKPVEWGTWGEVFRALDGEISKIRNKPAGPAKDAALGFYEKILSDLRAIQSLYRDPTMHLRDSYDDGQAQSAMFRVRELMAMLASQLSEDALRPISWSRWK